ncbi:MAG TPA: PQQ-binding-like beta-propeller repeat protein [Planctomycetota bacterium]|nr:PQQ-binding-like beta-propeller repeat protein [Planctomycetota bacterium]
MRGAALAVLALAGIARAQDWPAWRGPKGDGTSAETGFPLRWSATEGVLWKVPVPGWGHSSPVLAGDRLFLTTYVESTDERKLLCLDARNGRLLWERTVLVAPKERKHRLNSYASSTPATDGRYIFTAFLDRTDFAVFCYDLEGNLVWKRVPGSFYSPHGFCSSPALYKDLVIFNGDQDADAWIVALERATGRERWRADRPNKTRSYVPPVVIEAAGRAQLVLSGSKCVASYDPDTGRLLWIVDGPTEQYVASLVYADGVLFVTGGYPDRYLTGIRPDGEGNVTRTHVLWQHEREGVSYVPSPVAWESRFFVVSDDGLASALEAKTGRRLWKERLGPHHSASPVAAGGYLYFTDDRGTTHVLKAGPTFERVARNELGEECYASPALSRGRIYLRTARHLWCLGER